MFEEEAQVDRESVQNPSVSQDAGNGPLNIPLNRLADRSIEPVPEDRDLPLSPEALKRILREIPLGFWVSIEKDDTVLFQSNKSIETWGDLEGQGLLSLDAPTELVAELQEHIDLAMRGDSVEYEAALPVTPKHEILYSAKLTPLREGEAVVGVLGIYENITEPRERKQFLVARRRLAEQLNKASHCEEALKLCFDSAFCVKRIQKVVLLTVDREDNATVFSYKGPLPEFFLRTPSAKIDKIVKIAAQGGEPLVRTPDDFRPEIAKSLRASHIHQVTQFPMHYDGHLAALLVIATSYPEEFPAWYVDELRTIASQTEAALVRIKTQEKLEADRQLLRQLLRMQERERQLISSEIHDGFVQDVIGAQMIVEALSQNRDLRDTDQCPEFFVRTKEMLDRSIKEARRFISDLRPLIIEEAGVVETVDFLIHRIQASSKIQVHYTHDKVIERFNPILEEIVFRIVQEGITNAVRHGEATGIKVNLTEKRGVLTLRIVDDGIGFHFPEAVRRGYGLQGILERASLFGGTATIESTPGTGTKITVKLPLLRVSDPS